VAESSLADGLREHVVVLGERIGERNLRLPAKLEAAAVYVEGVLRRWGAEVRREEYRCRGAPVRNVEGVLKGAGEGVVLVGAHYDSVAGSPGANDNGSGVAALLEMARLLAGRPLAQTVRLVAFVNEEPPFFQSPEMGSYVHAAEARRRGDPITAMFSLETVGCYSDEPGSQRYPMPLGLFYPNVGNFVGFVSNLPSRGVLHRAVAAFRRHTSFPCEQVAVPGWIAGVGWSDHWSFWKHGYPGVMVTDTAPFRYVHYHTAEDTPDKIDYPRMAEVVKALTGMVGDLAGAMTP